MEQTASRGPFQPNSLSWEDELFGSADPTWRIVRVAERRGNLSPHAPKTSERWMLCFSLHTGLSPAATALNTPAIHFPRAFVLHHPHQVPCPPARTPPAQQLERHSQDTLQREGGPQPPPAAWVELAARLCIARTAQDEVESRCLLCASSRPSKVTLQTESSLWGRVLPSLLPHKDVECNGA